MSTSDNGTAQKNKINFQNIIDSYNSICVSLPKVLKLTETRKKAIVNATEIIGNSENNFKLFFEKVENSDFLCGRTDKQWSGCGFDWVLKKNNVVKILEGNYSNQKQTKEKSGKPDYYDISRYENLGF